VYLRHSADAGSHWDGEQALTDGSSRAEHPVVTAVAGSAAVAWADNRTGPFDIWVQQLGVDAAAIDVSAPGKVTSAGTPLDTRSPRYPASLFPSLAAAPSGRLAVAWSDDRFDPDPLWTGSTGNGDGTDPDDWEVLAALRRPGQGWMSPVNVSHDAAAADRHPSIVFDRAGRLDAIWDTKPLQSSGVNLTVRWSQSSDGGKTWTTGAPVGSGADAGAMSERPRLSVDAAGVVRAVWYDSRSADWRWSVWTSVLRSRSWSAPSRLTGDGNATFPALAGDTIAFTTDRMSSRNQRDRSQAVFVTTISS
jgi:hypothetical protein